MPILTKNFHGVPSLFVRSLSILFPFKTFLHQKFGTLGFYLFCVHYIDNDLICFVDNWIRFLLREINYKLVDLYSVSIERQLEKIDNESDHRRLASLLLHPQWSCVFENLFDQNQDKW